MVATINLPDYEEAFYRLNQKYIKIGRQLRQMQQEIAEWKAEGGT